jgi:hypothetical protein
MKNAIILHEFLALLGDRIILTDKHLEKLRQRIKLWGYEHEENHLIDIFAHTGINYEHINSQYTITLADAIDCLCDLYGEEDVAKNWKNLL